MDYQLKPYAVINTLGREHLDSITQYRSDFQRDRDRIIHSTAFRRLQYKTQVLTNHKGDLFRTRLTHSLEVAQIGRSVAFALNLNTDLVEAICLSHDLGHAPFGHLGQDELNSCLINLGLSGFEHNLQSLRIVDKLEERYAAFDGLNLTFETREGILKHCSLAKARELGVLGERFINKKSPSLEAQVANIADELAYNYHDIDDGLRANLITLEQLCQFKTIDEKLKLILSKYPQLSGRRLHKELVRNLINDTICDLIENTAAEIIKHRVTDLNDVQNAPVLVRYSAEMLQLQRAIKKFLHKNFYSHHLVMQLRFKASHIMRQLFQAYMSDAMLLPHDYYLKIAKDGLVQVVTDYIAGMTDRYAFRQYNRLFTVEAV